MLSMNMKVSKVFKKDVEKHLGIILDRRRKDTKEYIAKNGGFENTIETLKSQLSGVKEYKVKNEVRQKQKTIQKEYIERKRNPSIRPKRKRTNKKTIEKLNNNAKIIQNFYRTQKDKNKIFTLKPTKIWDTKFSYNIINELPSGKIRVDFHLNIEDFINVFQYYKIPEFLIEKINEMGKGYKLNIGFDVTIIRKEDKNDKKELNLGFFFQHYLEKRII